MNTKISERINMPKLYCGKNMIDQSQREFQTEYEKSIPLKVQKVKNGIVHPLISNCNSHETSGGVTDEYSKFIELSLTKRVSPPNFSCEFTDWYSGASQNFESNSTEYIDEDVVFLGALSSHYGHFITEGLARLWFFLDSENAHYKCVYISDSRNNRFLDCFRFFGIKDQDLIEITKPTRFRSVIVPEQSIRLHDYCHSKYKETIDKIKEKIEPAAYAKVFFSKANSGSGRAIGELPIQNIFEKNGFTVFIPEKMSMYETISVLKGCHEFVATSGTNIHNSIFMEDGKTTICLNRSAHFHPLQTMIDSMKKLKATYVDIFIFSTNNNFGNEPCFVMMTSSLRQFFNDRNLRYNNIFILAITPFYFVRYLSYPLNKKIMSLYGDMISSDYRSVRFVAEMLRKVKRLIASGNIFSRPT